LVRLKPPSSKLTSFYLMVALGGALGGIFVNFVAVRYFAAFWELHLSVLAAFLIVGYSLFSFRKRPTPTWFGYAQKSWIAGSLVLIGFLLQGAIFSEDGALLSQRNFHGVLRVHEFDIGKLSHRRVLYNGQINHGLQLQAPNHQGHIGSYYSSQSGLGVAIQQHPARLARTNGSTSELGTDNLSVGVIGLGVGVIASWGLPGDFFCFYEINPAVISIADSFFSLIKEAKCSVEILAGDGRLTLEHELQKQGSRQFDILVVDAFSGDAIPVHLLTIEAVQLYFKHLKPDGILAFNITNRHLELEPIIAQFSGEIGIPSIIIKQEKRYSEFISSSKWALVTRNEKFLQNPRVIDYSAASQDGQGLNILWSDNFSSLFPLLK